MVATVLCAIDSTEAWRTIMSSMDIFSSFKPRYVLLIITLLGLLGMYALLVISVLGMLGMLGICAQTVIAVDHAHDGQQFTAEILRTTPVFWYCWTACTAYTAKARAYPKDWDS